MGKRKTGKYITIYLIFIALVCIAALAAYFGNVIFRQHIKLITEFFLIEGLLAVLLTWYKEVPEESAKLRLIAKIVLIATVVLVTIGILLQVFMGIPRETVTETSEGKKVKVESSWIMYYEAAYHDYGNFLWYRRYPYYVETYDDGDPGQYLYTDYYDENGDYADRVYAEGQEP